MDKNNTETVLGIPTLEVQRITYSADGVFGLKRTLMPYSSGAALLSTISCSRIAGRSVVGKSLTRHGLARLPTVIPAAARWTGLLSFVHCFEFHEIGCGEDGQRWVRSVPALH
jgi:hypothetical protein